MACTLNPPRAVPVFFRFPLLGRRSIPQRWRLAAPHGVPSTRPGRRPVARAARAGQPRPQTPGHPPAAPGPEYVDRHPAFERSTVPLDGPGGASEDVERRCRL